MVPKIKVTIDDSSVRLPKGAPLLVRKCCRAVLELEGFPWPAEISVSFVTDERIHELNRRYRHIDRPTDVLSFPLGENGQYDDDPATGAKMLGDIVISLDTAKRQAEEYGHSLEREIGFLTVHSMLHLLGYDHVDEGIETVRMREKEETVLSGLGYRRDGNYVTEDENG